MGEGHSIPEVVPKVDESRPKVVNSFSIVVATINGTGSQTSNMALLRALFRMGIPVGGKNLFPSNIQGLPTWFRIRLDADGFTGVSDSYQVLVSLNPVSFHEDLAGLEPGGVCFYPEDTSMDRPSSRTSWSTATEENAFEA